MVNCSFIMKLYCAKKGWVYMSPQKIIINLSLIMLENYTQDETKVLHSELKSSRLKYNTHQAIYRIVVGALDNNPTQE